MRLAFRAASVLGVDHVNDGAMARIITATEAALRMARLLTDSLLRTAAFAARLDPSGLSSLATLIAELSSRRSRRLEYDGLVPG
jgi:aminoglycoside phosphotransferase family enzyme